MATKWYNMHHILEVREAKWFIGQAAVGERVWVCGLAYYYSILWLPEDRLAVLHFSLQSTWVSSSPRKNVQLHFSLLSPKHDLCLAVTQELFDPEFPLSLAQWEQLAHTLHATVAAQCTARLVQRTVETFPPSRLCTIRVVLILVASQFCHIKHAINSPPPTNCTRAQHLYKVKEVSLIAGRFLHGLMPSRADYAECRPLLSLLRPGTVLQY